MSGTPSHGGASPAADTLTPADRYQELFVDVQTSRVFDDSKTFVDCSPIDRPMRILERYRRESRRPGFDLAGFVGEQFTLPVSRTEHFLPEPGEPIGAHISRLWDALTRTPLEHPPRSSLLPLPEPYVVPGGRFRELYYWDSYFTMLGLAAEGRRGLVRGMTDDFAYLIDAYGHVPNANRTYYLSRSQPPVFAFMVELCRSMGAATPLDYAAQLRQEYSWWMEGADDLREGETHGRCVRMEDGAVLNRYWDDRDSPREESFREDVATAGRSRRPVHEVYRDLRAAAASGWDFSSRWCSEPGDLSTIMTTSIVPVDLNAFLHRLETAIAEVSEREGDDRAAARFRESAAARVRAIDRWLWDASAGAYADYDLCAGRVRPSLTAACVAPLWVGIASSSRAAEVASAVRDRLLRPGGLGTSEHETGEQWDRPNGWAPLQWMAVRGFARYREAIAADLQHRWLRAVDAVYRRDGRLVEKYAMLGTPESTTGGGGGEYPLQDGFGWTNGVVQAMLKGFDPDGRLT
ncbi:alpha,alpha-trehalase TreF [Agromyces neolithicus]|uniref:Alpha,alpha-trehalase TreF n=1 Tax=Agromyces neolithicus TaxID=269420 RepID=A0ABN2MCF0_9MICO